VSNPEKSKEEEDQQERNTKKAKGGDQSFSLEASKITSYRNKVIGMTENNDNQSEFDDDVGQRDEDEEEDVMKVEENTIGGYACPEFVFSKSEEKRIYRPWRRGVIVKLLGRRIGYKALETRLKQMWVRKGVISIIDLSNDYYLVAFTNEEDQAAALMDGPWFIYDHYLTVKEWSPNFHPASDTIKEVAVWVRISGLPIEYYDAKVLNFIGNRVGKTVKVDKNTLTHERGKYARLCVQVDLSKPVLGMFTIKGRKYNIEYEGLHMLCLTCGKFGHYKEGCQDRGISTADQREGGVQMKSNGRQGQDLAGANLDGPWRVVQKQRRGRKAAPTRNNAAEDGKNNGGPTSLITEPTISGSRFASLSEEIPENNANDLGREEEIPVIIAQDVVREEPITHKENNEENSMEVTNLHADKLLPKKGKRGNNGMAPKNGNGNQERISKDLKLTTRGGGNFKSKSGAAYLKGTENLFDIIDKSFVDQSLKKNMTGNHKKNINEELTDTSLKRGELVMGHNVDPNMGQQRIENPNAPRPPNLQHTTPGTMSHIPTHVGSMSQDNDLFLDATDNASVESTEVDMEVVEETPHLRQ
jgi:hypothetical protein